MRPDKITRYRSWSKVANGREAEDESSVASGILSYLRASLYHGYEVLENKKRKEFPLSARLSAVEFNRWVEQFSSRSGA